MPFIPPKRRGWTPPRPSRGKQGEQSPLQVSPEWGGTDLPDLRDKDVIPGILGGQIEHNFNKTVDPFDCEAWPNSPFCDPASTFNLEDFIGLNIEFSANECGASARIQPTLAWLNLTPGTITWRSDRPECQPAAPQQQIPTAPTETFTPYKFGKWGCMYVGKFRCHYPGYRGLSGGLTDDVVWYFWGPFEGWGILSMSRQIPGRDSYDAFPRFYAHGNADFYPNYYGERQWPHLNPSTATTIVGFRSVGIDMTEGTCNISTIFIEEVSLTTWRRFDPTGPTPNWFSLKAQYNQGNCKNAQPVPLLPSPPRQSMCNCKQIESDLKAIKKYLGVDKSGWTVPNSLRGTEVGHEEITNFTDFAAWFATQFIETIGDTKIKITVKDADPIADGDQEKTLIFDNLAQAVTELLGLALSGAANQSLIYKTATNALLQAGEATIAASKAALNIDEIIDFLAYGVKDETEDLNLFFTPGKNDPDEFLDPSEQKVDFRQMVDKQTMQSFMQKMLAMAAIYTSLNSINPNSDDFPKMIEGIRQLAKGTDLNSFINEVESGFQGAAGNPEITRPYGGPYSQRPRIKKWEGDGSDDGGTT